MDYDNWQWQLIYLVWSVLNAGWDANVRCKSAEFGGIICKSCKYPASDHGYQCTQQGFSSALAKHYSLSLFVWSQFDVLFSLAP